MLRKNRTTQTALSGLRFAMVASRYNARYVNGLVAAAKAEFRTLGAGLIEVLRVPGAFEIPMAASELARRVRNRPAAILCLGVIWQGETAHAHHIGEAITQALMQLQMTTGVPCIHEVLLVKDRAQARARCLTPSTNRGTEAAQTAVAMANLLSKIRVK